MVAAASRLCTQSSGKTPQVGDTEYEILTFELSQAERASSSLL